MTVDLAKLIERLRAQITGGHAKGCDGRTYSCDCGYDLSTEGLLEQAAEALSRLSGENADLRCLVATYSSDANEERSRAETAERQRDEAIERAAKDCEDVIKKATVISDTDRLNAQDLLDDLEDEQGSVGDKVNIVAQWFRKVRVEGVRGAIRALKPGT